jgi:hypothetical protein
MVEVAIQPDNVGKRVRKVVCRTIEDLLALVVEGKSVKYWINHKQVARWEAEDFLRNKAKLPN